MKSTLARTLVLSLAPVLAAGCAGTPAPTDEPPRPLKLRSLGEGRAVLVGDLEGGGRSELVVMAPEQGVAVLVHGEDGRMEEINLEFSVRGAAAVELEGTRRLALLLTPAEGPALLELRGSGQEPTRERHPVAPDEWIREGRLELLFALSSLSPRRVARALGLEWEYCYDCARPRCAVGDFDADGRRELAFVADRGCVIVEVEGSGQPRELATDLEILSAGTCVLSPGDLDGDGADDLVLATSDYCWSGVAEGERAGSVVAYSGRTGDRLWSRTGEGRSRHLGFGLASAGDLDGDGVTDLATAAHVTFGSMVFFLSGADGQVLHRGPSENMFPELGRRIDAGGDWDGDGVLDLVTTAYSPYCVGVAHQGAYVLSGEDGHILAEVVLDADGVVRFEAHDG